MKTLQKKVAVLGSTGSVGTQALDVIRMHEGLSLCALSAKSNVEAAERQIREFSPAFAAMADPRAAAELMLRVADTGTRVFAGREGIAEMIASCGADVYLNSVLGFEGLFSTREIIKTGKTLALANKESIVTAGELVLRAAKRSGTGILPVDSEHCAIHQCLRAGEHREIKKLLLTASGGPFYGYSPQKLEKVTREETLAHPTWKMGRKITVDSATLMNKGFEVIEASRLFDVPGERIEVLVHRESIVHSAVEFSDHAILAQPSLPDMRFCAQYAITYPDRLPGRTEELSLAEIGALSFARPDPVAFPLLALAYRALADGGVYPAVLNAANEEAVHAFLDGKIRYPEIAETVAQVYESAKPLSVPLTFKQIYAADADARLAANEVIRRLEIQERKLSR